MTSLRLLIAAGLVATLTFGGFASAAVTGSTALSVNRRLDVSSTAYPGGSTTAISFELQRATGVTLRVPRGYTIDLTAQPGTTLGAAAALVTDRLGDLEPAFAQAEVVADDPAKYVSDPAAQACAPGTHAAVWSATFPLRGEPVAMAIFVDPAAEKDTGVSYVLRFCPLWEPSANLRRGASVVALAMLVDDVVKAPSARGAYTWSALVTPAEGPSIAPGSRDFELRSVVPVPHKLTLRAEYSKKTKSVVLSGRLTAEGRPQAGRKVSFVAVTDPYDPPKFFGPVRTNAAGKFSIRRRVNRTTQFTVSLDVAASSCRAASSAPGGCVETVSRAGGASANVVFRAPTDPKLAARSRDQALARRVNLKIGDFPAGWQGFVRNPFSPACPRFEPDFSDLVATGQAASADFESVNSVAYSRSSVYRSEVDARTAFRRAARAEAARCIVGEEAAREGVSVRKISRIAVPRLGDETRAFRVVFAFEGEVVVVDVVHFRVGRLVATLVFSSSERPLAIARQLAAKVAVRARG